MDREKLRELLRRRPFEPFRIHIKDGRTYDVLLPDIHILGSMHINIGLPERCASDEYCDESVIVILSDISRVEMLSATAESSTSVGS